MTSLTLDVAGLARALATATDPVTRLRLQADVVDSGTHASVVHDDLCGLQMTLLAWCAHVRHTRGHQPYQVQVVTEILGDPVATPPARDGSRPRRRTASPRRRAPATTPPRGAVIDLNDPDIRERLAGAAGERYDTEDRP